MEKKDTKRVEKLHKEITKFLNRLAGKTDAKPVLVLQYPDKDFLVFGLDKDCDKIIADLYDKLFPSLEEEVAAIGKMTTEALIKGYAKADIQDLLCECDELPDGKEKTELQDILFDAMNKIASKRRQSK